MPTTNPHRLYRTYTVLGENLNGSLEAVSITETEVPETLMLRIGEGNEAAEILLHREAWTNLIRAASVYNYGDFTWVPAEPANPTTDAPR